MGSQGRDQSCVIVSYPDPGGAEGLKKQAAPTHQAAKGTPGRLL